MQYWLGLTCFCLCYDANTKKVQGLSGSGRSPEALTIELLKVQVLMRQSLFLHAHNITVPSTIPSWCEAVSLYGSKKISGYMLQLFQELTKSGKRRFYEGCVAEAIIETVQKNGGIMDLEDLKSHVTNEVKPIYKDVNVWEIAPNGQGSTDIGHSTADYLHVLIEALKLSLSVTFWFCADRDKVPVPTKELLSKIYAKGCSEIVNLQKASDRYNKGNLLPGGSDTVCFTVVNGQGNASSFINSNYIGFGIGLEPGALEIEREYKLKERENELPKVP